MSEAVTAVVGAVDLADVSVAGGPPCVMLLQRLKLVRGWAVAAEAKRKERRSKTIAEAPSFGGGLSTGAPKTSTNRGVVHATEEQKVRSGRFRMLMRADIAAEHQRADHRNRAPRSRQVPIVGQMEPGVGGQSRRRRFERCKQCEKRIGPVFTTWKT